MAGGGDAPAASFAHGLENAMKASDANKGMDMADAFEDLFNGLIEMSSIQREILRRIEQLESTVRQIEHRGGGLLGR
jgi:hypothetical protein